MSLHSAPYFTKLGSLKNTTRTWYHSARSPASCLLLQLIHCLCHHSRKKQQSTSSSSKLCDKHGCGSTNKSNQVFSKAPGTTYNGERQVLHPSKKRQSTLLQRRSKKPGSHSESGNQVPSMTRALCTQIFNNKRICKPYSR